MGYRNLAECVLDLEKHGHLVRVHVPVDARLEVSAIQRRVYATGGPAIFFSQVKGCRFPMLGNLFGTLERTRFLFRDTLESVQRLIALKADPGQFLKRPQRYWKLPATALHALPRSVRSGPVLRHRAHIADLPQQVSWPRDGGPFITLPQVYTEDPRRPGLRASNLGMYRVQLAGNQYTPNEEIGLHYQIHRSIGVHHAASVERGKALRVNIFVGGTPAMTVAAVMPLPEGLSELMFAGALAGHRIPMIRRPRGLPIYAEADFCITGTIVPGLLKPEGPFGDHLGYYSLAHDYPVLRVDAVYHRKDAIWPFTTVGRPPQEDTNFGALIHELTGPMIPAVLPGVQAVHAVDSAGVHPLLLAIGSERYTPYLESHVPMELLTQASAILGNGQLSLAKYLWIAARQDAPDLRVHDEAAFLRHMLERVDWRRDLHFHTCTTIDTLDYSGTAINEGSKVVIAAVGPKRRELPAALPPGISVPPGFSDPRVCLPGVLAVQGPPCTVPLVGEDPVITAFCADAPRYAGPPDGRSLMNFPLLVIVDDSAFAAANLRNFLWVTFTRSNPAHDIYGVGAFIDHKHWGCTGPLVIDARAKPHHAPLLEEDPVVTRRVEALAAKGGPLHGVY